MDFQCQADDFILRVTRGVGREWAGGGLAGFLRWADSRQETLLVMASSVLAEVLTVAPTDSMATLGCFGPFHKAFACTISTTSTPH